MDKSKIVYKYIFPFFSIVVGLLVLFLIVSFLKGNTSPVNEFSSGQAYTEAQVSEANDIKGECLTIVNASVYKLTEDYANRHPGGCQQVENMCGKDSSSLFEDVHGTNQKAIEQLNAFKVGYIYNGD